MQVRPAADHSSQCDATVRDHVRDHVRNYVRDYVRNHVRDHVRDHVRSARALTDGSCSLVAHLPDKDLNLQPPDWLQYRM